MEYLSNTSHPQMLATEQAWRAFPAPHQALLRQGYCAVAHIIEQSQTPTMRDLEQFIVNDPTSAYRVCCFQNCHRRFHHTRRQRAIAHIRRHFGYQPYACDRSCGNPAWYVSRWSSLSRANWSLHAPVLLASILILIYMLTTSVIHFSAQGGQYLLPIYGSDHSFYVAEGPCVIRTDCAMSDRKCVNGVAADRWEPCPVCRRRSTQDQGQAG